MLKSLMATETRPKQKLSATEIDTRHTKKLVTRFSIRTVITLKCTRIINILAEIQKRCVVDGVVDLCLSPRQQAHYATN